MGKAYQGVFGNWSGKTGNVVGRIRENRTIYAIYQPNVANPNTEQQRIVRGAFTALAQFFSMLGAAARIGFRDLDGYKYGTWFSAAVGYNKKIDGSTIWTPVSEVTKVGYDVVKLSLGTLLNLQAVAGTLDGSDISASWTDNSGMVNATADDKIVMALCVPELRESIVQTEAAKRSDRTAVVTCPSSWSGSTVEAWVFVTSPDGSLVSTSQYLGSFNP